MPALWLDLQATVANALHNWEATRSYAAAPTECRRPGFTESWGVRADHDHDKEDASSSSSKERPPLWGWSRAAEADDESDTPDVDVLTLVQFRPAWALQLALRAAGVDHVVVNASYAVTEATGPLPYVRDGRALVGGPAVWPYLVAGHDDDKATTTKTTTMPRLVLATPHRTSHVSVGADEPPLAVPLLLELVTDTLAADVLDVLRYQDAHAWHTTERPRSLRAVHGTRFVGHWHVWAARVTASAAARRPASVADAMRVATRAYAFLEQALQAAPHIFLDAHFSRLGLALWEHLMHALADTHLAPLLARYPGLVAYAQRLWEHYFDDDSGQPAAQQSPRNQANQEVNAANAFFVAPPSSASRTAGPDEDSWQAHLTRLSHQVQEQQREQQQAAARRRTTTVSPTTTSNETAEAAVAAYQTADQRWMASVVLVAVLAVAQMVRGAQVVGGE
jgi:hypothetical protein